MCECIKEFIIKNHLHFKLFFYNSSAQFMICLYFSNERGKILDNFFHFKSEQIKGRRAK